jgi:hypothetical protein
MCEAALLTSVKALRFASARYAGALRATLTNARQVAGGIVGVAACGVDDVLHVATNG